MFEGLTPKLVDRVVLTELQPIINERMEIGGDKPSALSRKQGHLVVLRAVPWQPRYHNSESDAFRSEVILREYTWWNGLDELEKPFDMVARSKAFASFVTGLPSHKLNKYPWMYQQCWTRWGGSAILKPEGANVALIVAYSGGKAKQDRKVSKRSLNLIAEACLWQFEDEVLPHQNVMWIGGQPPVSTQSHMRPGAPTGMHDGT